MTGPIDCIACREIPIETDVLWENDLFIVRHLHDPYGVPGWMLLYTRRHVDGPLHFTDDEAGSFGRTLRLMESTLEAVTGAERIYTATNNEGWSHFHCHIVPRYKTMPDGIPTGLGFWSTLRRAKAGEITVDSVEVARISAAFQARLDELLP